jgi:parallel beta-helix repeat protein
MVAILSRVTLLALSLVTGIAFASPEDALRPKLVGEGPTGDDNGAMHACTGVQAVLPAVVCVRAGAPGGGTGTVASPFASINAAIAAAKAGDIVQVAAGTYSENVALGSFVVPSSKHLTLLGGFSSDFGSRAAAANRSIVNGGALNPAVQLHVDSSQTTTLDGFDLIGGIGLGTDFSDGGGAGGGVHANQYGDGAMVISHNRIYQNQTRNHTTDDTRGGGIHAETQNFDDALATVRIEDNHVYDNLAGKGAGINIAGRQATLLRNRVQDNIAHNDHGGGIYVSTVTTEVRNNIIRGNSVGATAGYGWGGGILIAAAGADLSGNLITGNTTPSAGSGVFWDEGAAGTMRNDLVVRNVCPSVAGAAIYVDGGPGGPSNVMLENVTVADHACPGIGGAIYIEDSSQITLKNAILWGNTQEFSTLTGGGFSIAYSITQTVGTGNVNSDPLFANAVGLDYHVRSTAGRYTSGGFVNDLVSSPAIDAGDPASGYTQETQPNGGRVNLGAFGNTPEASRSSNGVGVAIFGDGFES